ncbi:peptide chain release factor 2 [Candidatus Saccharibacteria bacterium]|nr:peptide chain release factor 2 [Candidatus Saccharibacteria bacterium]
MKPIIEKLSSLLAEVQRAMEVLALNKDAEQIAKLEADMQSADFWSNQSRAEEVSRRAAELKKYLVDWHRLQDDVQTTLELAETADNTQLEEFEGLTKDLEKRIQAAMVAVRLNGEYDKSPAIIQITAGVGGTDAADWAQILMEMYLKYAERQGLKAEVLDTSYGEEAGIKSATVRISGPFAYGLLKAEKGVHRLVRLSPFNAQNLRQTSFALVDMVPEIEDEDSEIDQRDLRIDTFRSSGRGGQSVNTTDSAVRITHIPTGVTVSVQNERSQLKNKQAALKILLSRLNELAREAKAENVSKLSGQTKSADWGAQIRSYVMQPYTKVKDHRSDYETNDVSGVLEGKLEPLIEAYLDWQLKSKN